MDAGARGLRRIFWITLTLAGVACALTLLFLGMRSVMGVGGFCAEGGPYEIRQRCPQGVPGIMVGSIWGGLALAFGYLAATWKYRVPGLGALLWPALFLSLGWNFFEYAFDPPGTGGGVIWGWLVCGVVFALMGGLPLLVAVPATIGGFVRGTPARPVPVPMPARAKRATERAGRATGFVHDLEALERLHRSGVLTDEEFEAAKKRVLDG